MEKMDKSQLASRPMEERLQEELYVKKMKQLSLWMKWKCWDQHYRKQEKSSPARVDNMALALRQRTCDVCLIPMSVQLPSLSQDHSPATWTSVVIQHLNKNFKDSWPPFWPIFCLCDEKAKSRESARSRVETGIQASRFLVKLPFSFQRKHSIIWKIHAYSLLAISSFTYSDVEKKCFLQNVVVVLIIG